MVPTTQATLVGRSAFREVCRWYSRPKLPWWNGLLSGNLSIVQTTQATLVGRSAVREVWQPMTLTAGRCWGSDVGPGQSGSYRTSMLSTRTVAERLSTAISRSTAAITCRTSRVKYYTTCCFVRSTFHYSATESIWYA